jgi:thiamine biosynthesis protein ThiS
MNTITVRTVIKLIINGETQVVSATTVFDLIEELGLHPKGTIVERNLEIVDVATYRETVLANGDVLELVRFVGGG